MERMRRRFAMLMCLMMTMNLCAQGVADFTLPAALEEIEAEAFDGDLALQGLVRLPQGLKVIGDHAFRGSNLYALRVPAQVEALNGLGLESGEKIAYVYLEGSTRLTDTTGVRYVFGPEGSPMKSFGGFVSTSSLALQDGFYYALSEEGATLLCAADDTLIPEHVMLPESVNGVPLMSVGPEAFWQLEQVTEIILGEQMTWESTSFSGAPKAKITQVDTSSVHLVSLTSSAEDTEGESVYYAGDTVTFTAAALGGTAPYRYQFEIYLGDTRLVRTSYSASAAYTYTFGEAGSYHVTVTVRDDDLNTDTLTGNTLSVLKKGANITVTSLVPSAVGALLGDTVTWTAAADLGVGSYRYAFELKNAAGSRVSYRGYSASDTFDTTFTEHGVYSMTVSVLDDEGNSAERTYEDFEVALAPLGIASLTSDAASPVTDEEITWTVEAQGGLAPYTYTFLVEEESAQGAENAFRHVFQAAGTYTLHVLVRDAQGSEVTKTKEVSVAQHPLEIAQITLDGENVQTEDQVTLEVQAIGGQAPYSYAFMLYYAGEEIDFLSYQAENTFVFAPEDAGEYSVEVLVRDSEKKTVRAQSSTIQVTRKPLTAEDVTLEPDAVRVHTPVTLTALAAGGQKPLSYAFDIYAGDELAYASAYSALPTLTYTPTASGEYTILLKVRDQEGTTAEVMGSTVLLVYDPLAISVVSASPSSAVTGDEIVFTAQVSGGKAPLSYVWSVLLEEETVYTLQTDTPSLSYAPIRAGSYTAKVKVIDAEGTEEELTGGSITVADSSHVTDESSFTFSGGTITGYKGTDTAVVVPETIGGKAVVAIGANAFKGKTDLVSIVLPESVKTLGNTAFQNCTGLLSVSLPGVQTIGQSTFSGCSNLRILDITRTLTEIGKSAFEKCKSLTELSFPDVVGDEWIDYGLKTINASAFSDCTSLVRVHLPDTLTGIYEKAFQNCTHLSEINYPKALTTVNTSDNGVFEGCLRLVRVEIPEGVTVLAAGLYAKAPALKEVILPGTLEKIDDSRNKSTFNLGAFQGCTALESIQLPESLSYIGFNAFRGCVALPNPTYPKALTYLGPNAYMGCTAFTEIVFPDVAQSEQTDYGLKTISASAFSDCTALVRVHLPDTVTAIYERAFQNCTHLSEINYPKALTTVNTSDNGVFEGCLR
ncbi:MAG: leucine-rich repeat protein, partial [Clostridia bacterium]|nr:leucine-rich repeat protein [Clostridia bacterium]